MKPHTKDLEKLIREKIDNNVEELYTSFFGKSTTFFTLSSDAMKHVILRSIQNGVAIAESIYEIDHNEHKH